MGVFEPDFSLFVLEKGEFNDAGFYGMSYKQKPSSLMEVMELQQFNQVISSYSPSSHRDS